MGYYSFMNKISDESRNNCVETEIRKFRTLQSYCSHDLRAEMGRAITSLRLLEEPTLDEASKKELIEIVQNSLNDGLRRLDNVLEHSLPGFAHVWIVSTDFKEEEWKKWGIENGKIIQVFDSVPAMIEARKAFRPDAVIVDMFQLEFDVILQQQMGQMGSGLTRVLYLAKSEQGFSLGDLEGAEIINFSVKNDEVTKSIHAWLLNRV